MKDSATTQEEKQFIAQQFVAPAQRYDDCVLCGRLIDSKRQNDIKGVETCGRESCGDISASRS